MPVPAAPPLRYELLQLPAKARGTRGTRGTRGLGGCVQRQECSRGLRSPFSRARVRAIMLRSPFCGLLIGSRSEVTGRSRETKGAAIYLFCPKLMSHIAVASRLVGLACGGEPHRPLSRGVVSHRPGTLHLTVCYDSLAKLNIFIINKSAPIYNKTTLRKALRQSYSPKPPR